MNTIHPLHTICREVFNIIYCDFLHLSLTKAVKQGILRNKTMNDLLYLTNDDLKNNTFFRLTILVETMDKVFFQRMR